MSHHVATTRFRIDGRDALTMHRTITDSASGAAVRLGLAELGTFLDGGVSASPDQMRVLARQLREVRVFAEVARMYGWVFGSVMVAPRDERVLAAASEDAVLWADPHRGFTLQTGDDEAVGVSESAGADGSTLSQLVGEHPAGAVRTGLQDLLAPLAALLESGVGPIESASD